MRRDDAQEEYYEAWYEALRRAVDLIDDYPFLEPDTILAALDDEFGGNGQFWPSSDETFVKAVYGNHVQMNREAFAAIVATR